MTRASEDEQPRVDLLPLAVLRIILGTTFWFWAQNFLRDDRWEIFFTDPLMLFKYNGFEWVTVWPGNGMWLYFQVTAVAAICCAVGFCTRLSALTLSVSMAYAILVERQIYNNHDYLLATTAALMTLLPAGQQLSVDSVLSKRLFGWEPLRTMPRWQWWLVRFQLGMPYVFGAIAKLDADWRAGQPAGLFVDSRVETPLIGPLFAMEHAAFVMAWGGLLFDALVVPALLYKPTRIPAVVAACVFHLTNATIFHIGVFPWFMLATLYVFFPDDFLLRLFRRGETRGGRARDRFSESKPIRWLIASYVVVQLLLPIRPWVLPGNPAWNERGQRFAWRMMLRHKECLLWYKVEIEDDYLFVPAQFAMSPNQVLRAPRDPEMVRQAAVRIGQEVTAKIQEPCRVYALALVSLNGRPPKLLIDPEADLTQVRPGWFSDPWVVQDPGPLPERPVWIDKEEWWQNIDMPDRFRGLSQYRPSQAFELYLQSQN
ncbi:MAG: HTTM domain-containing protein [Planctomycetota bacterium]